MRSRNEVIQAVCEQVAHGIKVCGWDGSDMELFSGCVDMAIDMVMTVEEIEEYGDVAYDVKTSIVL